MTDASDRTHLSRRELCAAVTVSATGSVAGCIDSEEGETETPTDTSTPTDTQTPTPTGTPTPTPTETPAEGTPSRVMPEGSVLVEVFLSSRFEDEVGFTADCREIDTTLEPGETLVIERETEGEECHLRFDFPEDRQHEIEVHDYLSLEVVIREDGTIDREGIAA